MSPQERVEYVGKAATRYVQEVYNIDPKAFCSQRKKLASVFKKEDWLEREAYPEIADIAEMWTKFVRDEFNKLCRPIDNQV